MGGRVEGLILSGDWSLWLLGACERDVGERWRKGCGDDGVGFGEWVELMEIEGRGLILDDGCVLILIKENVAQRITPSFVR